MIYFVEFDPLNELTYKVLEEISILVYQNHQNYIIEPYSVEFKNVPQFSGKYRIVFEFSIFEPKVGYSVLFNQNSSLCLTTGSPKPYFLYLNSYQIFVTRWIENENLFFAVGKVFSFLFALWYGKKERIEYNAKIPDFSWIKNNTPVKDIFLIEDEKKEVGV